MEAPYGSSTKCWNVAVPEKHQVQKGKFKYEGIYHQFNEWIHSFPAAYKIRMRCVKIAFQTPSSNSWRRSGTKSEKKLKPKGYNRVEKAFFI
jgi:hypothetical protein